MQKSLKTIAQLQTQCTTLSGIVREQRKQIEVLKSRIGYLEAVELAYNSQIETGW